MSTPQIKAAATLFDQTKRRRSRRDAVIQTASYLFNETGVSGTSLDDVAHALGLTRAALYYYVKSKEDLVYLCYSNSIEVGETALNAAREVGGTGLDMLCNFIKYQLELGWGLENTSAVLSELTFLEPERREQIIERARANDEGVRRLIEQGVQDGSIDCPSPQIVERLILGAINWLPWWYSSEGQLSISEISDIFCGFVTNGLKARDS